MNRDVQEILDRAAERRRRMVVHRATGFDDAEAWDLEYWQSRTPEERMEAFLALKRDVVIVLESRERDRRASAQEDGRL
ncbi:MAG: hypothetical protein GXP47_14775 [Acidobacteria bacterium]|nr:hypothetical protein [Acidobacteriota bacterium]